MKAGGRRREDEIYAEAQAATTLNGVDNQACADCGGALGAVRYPAPDGRSYKCGRCFRWPVEQTPPGETAADELTGAQSIEAISDALLDITGAARVKFSNVRDIAVTKVGRWVLIKVRSRGPEPHELTFRINKAWAQVLKGRLMRALGE